MAIIGFYRRPALLIGLLLAVIVAGCSGTRPYRSEGPKNLTIATRTEASSPFSSVWAQVDVYRVDAGCRADYRGTLKLNRPSVGLGLPAGETGYLVFHFGSSSCLANTSGSVSYDTLLRPRAGYRYDLKASYVDDIYNVTIRESESQGMGSREIERRPLAACNTL